MSETETHIGKAKLLTFLELENPDTPKETLEQKCKSICDLNKYILDPKFYDSYRDLLSELGYGRYIIVGQDIYEILEDSTDEADLCSVKGNPDGTLDYFLQFYNGGCSFNEAFQYALKRRRT